MDGMAISAYTDTSDGATSCQQGKEMDQTKMTWEPKA